MKLFAHKTYQRLALGSLLLAASAVTSLHAAGGEEEIGGETAATSAYAGLTGDASKGRRFFAKCMACHTVQEGQHRVGPSLHGIVGKKAGSIAGFNYSEANKNSGVEWTEENLFVYLKNPQEFMPGTRMIFPGIASEQERADLIAYLKAAAE